MISGSAEKFCFGPAEISVMRRAMKIVEQALRRSATEQLRADLRPIARIILRLTAAGHSDPLVLSAATLREYQATSRQSFYPYERRTLRRRTQTRAGRAKWA